MKTIKQLMEKHQLTENQIEQGINYLITNNYFLTSAVATAVQPFSVEDKEKECNSFKRDKPFDIPSLEQVKEAFISNGVTDRNLSESFYKRMSEANWSTKSGTKYTWWRSITLKHIKEDILPYINKPATAVASYISEKEKENLSPIDQMVVVISNYLFKKEGRSSKTSQNMYTELITAFQKAKGITDPAQLRDSIAERLDGNPSSFDEVKELLTTF